MRMQKFLIIVTMVGALLLFLVGCCSNPMTSTANLPAVQNDSQNSETAAEDQPGQNGGIPAGNPADVPDYPPDKYDGGEENQEAPLYPN